MTAATFGKRLMFSAGSSMRRKAWRFRRLIFVVVLLCASLVAGTFYVFERIPLPPDVIQAESSFLYDAQGKLLGKLSSDQYRVYVKLAEIPQILQHAVISREDRSFYKHRGVDPVGIARATWRDLVARKKVQGGSTITQQYVKNAYVGNERSYTRKFREAAISVRLESEFSKQQILERYLNTIYFGRGAYGVSAAASAYYNKDVKDLDLNESSYLAALISNPNRTDVDNDLALATRTRDEVLSALRSEGKISEEMFNNAKATPLMAFVKAKSDRDTAIAMPEKGTRYFVEMVRQELVKRYGEDVVLRGGLRVTTTLDLDQQAKAYDSVFESNRPKGAAGALVAINNRGEVTALVGGKDWTESKVNLALGSKGGGSGRQPGSTYKAIMLAELVHQGYSINSTFAAPESYVIPNGNSGKDYKVENAERSGAGISTVTDATAASINTVYAQIVQLLGPSKLVEMSKKLGITSPLIPAYSLVLGSVEVSPLEMASVFSTFANRGMHVDPYFIKEVRTPDGKLLSGSEPKQTRVLTTKEADTVNYVLQQAVSRGTGGPAAYGGPAAGKTGTTTDHADVWFVGYNPLLTTAVWVGHPEGRVSMSGAFGGTVAAPIWRRFMSAVFQGVEVPKFSGSPSNGGKVLVNKNYLPTSTTTTLPPDASTTVPEATTSTLPGGGGTTPTSSVTTPPTTSP